MMKILQRSFVPKSCSFAFSSVRCCETCNAVVLFECCVCMCLSVSWVVSCFKLLLVSPFGDARLAALGCCFWCDRVSLYCSVAV